MKALPWYLLAIMAVITAFLLWRDSRRTAERDSLKSALQEKEDTIRYFKTQSGRTASVKVAAEVSREDLENHYPELVSRIKDLEINIKNLRAITSAGFQARGSGLAKVIRDTIYLPGVAPVVQDSININDGYLSMNGRVKDGHLRYQYAYQDSIIFSVSGKKKWLFGKETLQGTARMSNPNARVTNQNAILMQGARDKRLVISVGVGYSPFGNQFYPSVHAGYALLRF